jgi:hypothetical protein
VADESPILLQRNCQLIYKVRCANVSIPGEITGDTIEAVLPDARKLLSRGRVQIDLYLTYDGQAANEEAKVHAGRKSRRVASFEVFENDLIGCPAGSHKLDPRHYKLAEAAQS